MYHQYYEPPPPEPLKSGVFTYDKDGIKAGGPWLNSTATWKRAREERVSREHAAKFATLDSPSREARFDPRLFLAKYFLGPSGAPDKEKQREALILEDVDGSDFSKAVQAVPGLVARVTRRLTAVGWEDTFARGLDAAFATCSAPGARFHIPTSEANFDLDRFMAKYFLDGLNGKPDPTKAAEPIELYPFFEHLPRLITVVESIPGLHLIRVKGANCEYTIVGWDMAKVTAIKKGHEDERERKKAEEEAKERQKGENAGTRHEQLGNYHDDLTLEIQKPASANGVVAAFNLGLIEGTMLLALSNDALHRLREEQPPELTYYEEEEEDESDSYGSNSKKRKASGSPGRQAIRRRLGETPKPNRVYLQWGGRMVDAEIEVDEGDEHTGYLDFDASKAIARGESVYPAMCGKERKLAFSIYKRGDQPRETPENWNYWTQKWYDIEMQGSLGPSVTCVKDQDIR
ncbi:hypothetical protein CNMCM5623_009604 [Aspergillus felis]|uniref:Uncharacterized protein n=1 Tax=Aspergillus felis TaxID=1287682 RepID=A0A8H6Q3X6_9EURO|nr:hypothetical protein CNMCM5623_009604 [Aspergillus felis]